MERNFITRNAKLRWKHLQADVSEFAVRTFTKHIYFQGLPFIAIRWSNSVVPSCVCGYTTSREEILASQQIKPIVLKVEEIINNLVTVLEMIFEMKCVVKKITLKVKQAVDMLLFVNKHHFCIIIIILVNF